MVFYMALFFGVIWAAWPIAVLITEKWLVKPEPAKYVSRFQFSARLHPEAGAELRPAGAAFLLVRRIMG